MGKESFKPLIGKDDADAVLPESLVEVVGVLLFPAVVLPKPFSGRALDTFLEEGEGFVHHAGHFLFNWLEGIGPNRVEIVDPVSSSDAPRRSKNDGAVGFVGEQSGSRGSPGASAKKWK